MSARELDHNGWVIIKKNPISKSGVFQYLGKSLGLEGLEPDKFYSVYRPAEELSDPEAIESFKLIPFIDNHAMIGPGEEMAAEDKGIHGVLGEDIVFEEPILYGNLKIFSETIADKIENEKQELSLGFNCLFFLESGVYNGQPYQVVQRKPRGNHLALIKTGRVGSEVRVLDQKEEVPVMEEEKKVDGLTLSSLAGVLDRIEAALTKLVSVEKVEDAEEKKPEEKKVGDAEEKKSEEKKAEDAAGCVNSAMDSAEFAKSIFTQISRKEALANQVSRFIGTFDSSEMTLDEVAKYALKELKITCPKGHEAPTLAGYLAAAKVNKPVATLTTSAMDSGELDPQINEMINGSN